MRGVPRSRGASAFLERLDDQEIRVKRTATSNCEKVKQTK